MMRAADIHARLGTRWPAILAQLGVPERALRRRHGPCPAPACGGKDRFRFDNKYGRGNFYCNQCGSGDGFRLLELVFGWPFAEARKRVIEAAGLSEGLSPTWTAPRARPAEPVATPPERVHRLRRERCAVADCDDVVDYLASRSLWPLPVGCSLWAHASAEYYDGPRRIGRYSALLVDVVDISGELVAAHTTYLQGGKKIEIADPGAASGEPRLLPPRKTHGKMDGRVGCAVRLMPATDVLGIAEGIETALSAAAIDGLPVWAALNRILLARFEPPPGVARLRIYADRDLPGLEAVVKLQERLQPRVRLGLEIEVRIPTPPAKDFNDTLLARNGRSGGEGIRNDSCRS